MRCPAKPSSWRRWTTSARTPRSRYSKPARKVSSSSPRAVRPQLRSRRPQNPRPPPAIRRWKRRPVDRASGMTDNAQSLHKVAVAGASGRMGHMLIEAIRDSRDCQLAGAMDISSSPAIGNDAAAFLGHASGVPVSADPRTALANAQVLIDFTRPEATMTHLKVCRELGVNVVIGTTGFGDGQKELIADAARDIAIVMAPNMSVGVNVTMKLLEMAAKALSVGYDIEVIETHHRHKVDAPSGTALKMGEVIAQAIGRDLKKH